MKVTSMMSRGGQARTDPLLSVKDLHVYFFTKQGVGKAIEGVNFDLAPGEIFGLMGESGSGKSLTALSILGLNPKPASQIVAGEIWFQGTDLLKLPPRGLQRIRGNHISMILQDPMTALNPVFTVGEQIKEPLRLHQGLKRSALQERAAELLSLLKVPDPEERLTSFPHQLSGGMRQRAVGAISLSCNPDLLIADEPTTSLDVTVQLAYLAHLKSLQEQFGLSILFITHDVGVISNVCDRVAVMYAGKIMETGPVETVFAHPFNPYTTALLQAVPSATVESDILYAIPGEPPSILQKPRGCPFRPRCALWKQLGEPEECSESDPELLPVDSSQSTACHFADQVPELEFHPAHSPS